nr:hypothetical protein [Flammeovirgaceae bacterium]
MIKKLTKTTLITSLLFLIYLPSFSCDVCNIFEYSMMKNKSYFGIFYRHRVFNGYQHLGNNHDFLGRPQRKSTLHEPENTGFYVNKSDKDYETYTTLELRGNYTFKEKFNFLFILPYERNIIYYDQVIDAPNPMKDSTINISGWGDLIIAMDYIIQKDTEKGKHTIRPGIAFRFPTGQFKKQDGYGNVHDPIIQPGTSALSVVFRMNYQYFLNKHGFNASVNYKLSELGKNQYQFANSFNLMGNYFHQIPVGGNYIIPKIGG